MAVSTIAFTGNDRVNIAERSSVSGPRTRDELRERLVGEAVSQIRADLAAKRQAKQVSIAPVAAR